MDKISFEIMENEYWYGSSSTEGCFLPFGKNDKFVSDLIINKTGNQASPIYLSNMGRYIWSANGFKLTADNGTITLEYLDRQSVPQLFESRDKSLRGAFIDSSKKFFPADGLCPPDEFFVYPQYNTWIELGYNQNQNDILKYANNIIRNDLPKGLIMIDDGWFSDFGSWDFIKDKFENPAKMIESLHEMGFKVLLWVCPFVSQNAPDYEYLNKNNCLVRSPDGSVKIVAWWDGRHPVLDLSNPLAVQWFNTQLDYLIKEYKVDGFKFDAGDAHFYSFDDLTYTKTNPNEQSKAWCRLGGEYQYNEFRASWNCAGKPYIQRLNDKLHSWEAVCGIKALVPNTLAQGILGYAFTCPDMIGGGDIASFQGSHKKEFSEELFVRYCQASALMPMMQFSCAPWRVLNRENFEICRKMANIHCQFSQTIINLAKNAAKTGEPIIRYMEYVFPHMGYEKITDQFMLGDNVLVAPVTEENLKIKKIILPQGKWKTADGEIYHGGEIEINCKNDTLPVFVKEQ